MREQDARRRWESLNRMTVARGCTIHEAETAARMARVLAAKFGFAETGQQRQERADFETRFRRAEATAARRWAWEYRRCGKGACHCMKGGLGHGPYKYSKRREGKKVSSIYIGL